jgi:hypothetical protein
MEVTAPQIKNGIPSKREWNPLPKVSSIGARSHHTEPRFCVFGRTDISYCDLNRARKCFKGATSEAEPAKEELRKLYHRETRAM